MYRFTELDTFCLSDKAIAFVGNLRKQTVEYCNRISSEQNLDIKDLAFSCFRIHGNVNTVDIVSSKDSKRVGAVKSHVYFEGYTPKYKYSCMVISEGTCFETLSARQDTNFEKSWIYKNGRKIGECVARLSNKLKWFEYYKDWDFYLNGVHIGYAKRGGYLLFDKWFYIENLVTADSLKILRDGKTSLPISIERRSDTLLDFIKAIIRLLTLYPLWFGFFIKSYKLKTEDTIIPQKGAHLAKESELLDYYLAVNVLFRMVYFEGDFESRSGP